MTTVCEKTIFLNAIQSKIAFLYSDFIAKKGSKKYYIQVSSDISSIETKTREIRPFIALNDSFQKIIVINRPLEETLDNNGFVIIGIADFY